MAKYRNEFDAFLAISYLLLDHVFRFFLDWSFHPNLVAREESVALVPHRVEEVLVGQDIHFRGIVFYGRQALVEGCSRFFAVRKIITYFY